MTRQSTTETTKNRKTTKGPQPNPTLRFSPTAWAKLLYLRDRGDTEVGGFGVTPEDDLLYVEDVVLVKQRCTPTFVGFEDASVADYFDAQCDAGRRPEQFARLWLHTHPGHSPRPSSTDEETFARVFGECEWAVMFILAEHGQSYARLAFHAGPGGALEIPVEVDFQGPFAGSDHPAWEREYQERVQRDEPLRGEGEPEDQHFIPIRDRERWEDVAWDSWWEDEERAWREAEAQYGEEAMFYE